MQAGCRASHLIRPAVKAVKKADFAAGIRCLIPAAPAVPAAAAKQQNDKYDDEKRGGIHMRFPRCCVLRSLKFWTSDNVLAGRPVPGIHVAR